MEYSDRKVEGQPVGGAKETDGVQACKLSGCGGEGTVTTACETLKQMLSREGVWTSQATSTLPLPLT